MFQKNIISAISLMILAILFSTFSVSFAGPGPNMKDGLWEITTKVEMAGMPMQMPAMTHTQCITKENAVPDSSQPNQRCKIVNNQLNGDTVTWEMECDTPEGKAKAVGEITYTGDTFEGTIKMNMQGMEMLQKMNGKWIGECKQ